MPRRVLLVLALAIVALAVPFAAHAFPPGGDPDEYTLRLPIAIVEPNPCNGELVSATGFVHLLNHNHQAASGNIGSGSLMNFQARGVGSLGNKYVVTYAGPTSETYTFAQPGETYGSRQTYVQHYNVIALGPVPDYHLTYLIHLTFTPEGEPTATVAHVESRCTS
jgi:hypothetical protein